MRHFMSIAAQGMLRVRNIIALAQITDLDPAYIAGDIKYVNRKYTREAVCEFLRQKNISSLCSIFDNNDCNIKL